MKPDELCVVDLDGKQVAGTKKRSSEILLHLSVMKARADVRACIHTHPPHATAFAVAHEPIPKCILPEFEVFSAKWRIAPYETPGTQAFRRHDPRRAPRHRHDHPGQPRHDHLRQRPRQDAYFKTEIIDAYCRILILAKQPGTINHYSDEKAAELIKIKLSARHSRPRLGARGLENSAPCGETASSREGYSDFKPEPKAFIPAKFQKPAEAESKAACSCPPAHANGQPQVSEDNVERLVTMITEQVMSVLGGK